MACICASRPGPPTAAISSSSGTSAPRTSLAACRIEARMIAPESITVPSRSKRTTGNRITLMLASRPAQPDGPGLDALDREDRVHPGIIRQPGTHVRFAGGVEDEEHGSLVHVPDGTAEDDQAFF